MMGQPVEETLLRLTGTGGGSGALGLPGLLIGPLELPGLLIGPELAAGGKVLVLVLVMGLVLV